ncbi:MAG: non-homologous end-joining DNA ligase [Patescibacteria group bacterium]
MQYEPMLASIGEQADLKKKGWLFEPKLDGTRAIMYLKDDQLTFINRNGRNLTHRYPEFLHVRKHIRAKQCVLDGEIVVYDAEGRPDFVSLAKRDHVDDEGLIEERMKTLPATYVVFDVLEKDGEVLIDRPLTERKEILADTIRNAHHIEQIFWSEHGQPLWKEVKRRKLEGVMAKDAASHYQPGERTDRWRKVKFLKTIDAVILGYTTGKRVISALALGAYHKGELTYLGGVGTGFTDDFLADLLKELSKIKAAKPPVAYNGTKAYTWVKPKVVCEVEYLELTKGASPRRVPSAGTRLRAPSFIRLRDDKSPKDCVLE